MLMTKQFLFSVVLLVTIVNSSVINIIADTTGSTDSTAQNDQIQGNLLGAALDVSSGNGNGNNNGNGNGNGNNANSDMQTQFQSFKTQFGKTYKDSN
jgi:hypothetical protein